MKTRRLQKTELSILPLSCGCGYGQCRRIESTVPPTVPQWVLSLRDQHGGLEQGNGDLCVCHLVQSGLLLQFREAGSMATEKLEGV